MTSGSRDSRRALRAHGLFDGRVLHSAQNVMVVLEDGVIWDVDFTGALPPPGMPFDDLGDVTLMPGLIDTHTHLAFDATDDVVAHVQQATSEQLLSQMRDVASSMLQAGITTTRDLGDRDYLSLIVRAETAADNHAGPTIVAAGPPLTPAGGHCWFLGGEANGTQGIRTAVEERAARGVDVIKMMATGGRMTPTTPAHDSQYSLPELRAGADRAHELGLTIAGHAHGRQGIIDAVKAGFDTLEHVTFATSSGYEPDQKVIEAIAAAGIIASMSLGSLPGATPPGFLVPVEIERVLAYLKNLHDSGVRLTLGPDGGISPSKPHNVLPHAFATLLAAGIPAIDILTAATATAADACGLTGKAGRILPGYPADLLAVKGNPVANIASVLTPAAIYRRGEEVQKADSSR